MRPSKPEPSKSGAAISRPVRFAGSAATVGRRQQSFPDAAWAGGLLRVTPKFMKKFLAFELLALRPPYFYRKEQAGASHADSLAAEAVRTRSSRRLICESILAALLKLVWKVVDYGCGPGESCSAAGSLTATPQLPIWIPKATTPLWTETSISISRWQAESIAFFGMKKPVLTVGEAMNSKWINPISQQYFPGLKIIDNDLERNIF